MTETRPFKNSNLFSNHYLEKLVRESPEWREAKGSGAAFSAIKELYERKARVLDNYNESQLEENFIRPVLRILGHFYGVQGKVQGKDRTPDYAFFPDQESLEEAEARSKEDYYKKAVAVGDAKAWKISLDKSRKGMGTFEMQNPSFQIDVYLRETPPKWAILSNGRLWRLYHETTSYKLDSYYEVDLAALLHAGDLENFKYFYLFFRREALPQAVDGDSFLDRVREGSVAYAQEIGEDLQENVYRAMKILAEGFLKEHGNGLSPSEATIQEVQENALRLLYRLLFIFYAESRGLLDVENKYYYELSLQKLKVEVSAKLDRSEPLLSVSYGFGERLKNLFTLINDGSESRRIPREQFYIPAYNGGLFDPEKNAFLEEKRIGDSFLARAIDLLSRSGEGRELGFVDYSSLEIRHLGSIYEGLLEYRLKVAEQEMAAVKEKGKELWLPCGGEGKRKILDRVAAGEIYLATDKGERKATGSYYTPDYIVKYIVKNTIEPVLEQKRQEWLGTSRPFAEYVLSIKVLDPAMGSGHFLVEATDQLARWLVQAWATARPEEADSKEVAEQDIHWARREVVRNCIYGVDLNPMAVELAKLSLWLTTVASNKPLSFLDHHLRCGNSLIGAELGKLDVLPGGEAEQTPLWNFVLKSHTDGLLKRFSLMAALPDDNLQMVKWKEEQFRQIKDSELSLRLNELANVWLSTFFGNKVSDDDYYELQNHLSPEKFPDWAGLRERVWFRRAQEMAEEKRFFHWELEFPEAFNGEGRGFDVVIGNPPYDVLAEKEREEDLSDLLNFIKSSKVLSPAQGKKIDLYRLIVARSCSLARPGADLGFIIPMSLLADQQTVNLRKYLIKNFNIVSIDAFPQKDDPTRRVFLEAKLPTCVIIFKNSGNDRSFPIFIHPGRYLSEISGSYDCNGSLVEMLDKDYFPIPLLSSNLASNIVRKLYSPSSRLCLMGNLLQTYQGEINETNLASILSPEPSVGPKVLRGGNVQRYEFMEEARQGIDKYIDVRKYGLQISGEKVAHTRFPRIGYQRNAALDSWRRLIFAELPSPSYCFDSISYFPIIDGKTEYAFLSMLNSELYEWRFRLTSTNNHVSTKEIANLPAIRFTFTTPAPERARLGAELQQLYDAGRFEEILDRVASCLPKDAAGGFAPGEKSDVVHDLLAFLAERMLEMNKQKQQEIRGFTGWLEGYVGAKVEELTPKTKIQSYYEHDYDQFLAVLKKNRKRLAIDPSRREPGEVLRAEYSASMNKLQPLREQIRRTDELIDAIVYRLYGLTDEEIRIVEGKAS